MNIAFQLQSVGRVLDKLLSKGEKGVRKNENIRTLIPKFIINPDKYVWIGRR